MYVRGLTIGAGTAYYSGAPHLVQFFSRVRVARQFSVECFEYHRLSFSPLYCLSRWCMAAEWPFGIFFISLFYPILIFCVMFAGLLFSLFCPFKYDHCITCPSSNYSFWLQLRCLKLLFHTIWSILCGFYWLGKYL